jgi:hypothetical protein
MSFSAISAGQPLKNQAWAGHAAFDFSQIGAWLFLEKLLFRGFSLIDNYFLLALVMVIEQWFNCCTAPIYLFQLNGDFYELQQRTIHRRSKNQPASIHRIV